MSSNPLLGGTGQFRLDPVSKESLEIFSNLLRVAVEKMHVMSRYYPKLRLKGGQMQGIDRKRKNDDKVK